MRGGVLNNGSSRVGRGDLMPADHVLDPILVEEVEAQSLDLLKIAFAPFTPVAGRLGADRCHSTVNGKHHDRPGPLALGDIRDLGQDLFLARTDILDLEPGRDSLHRLMDRRRAYGNSGGAGHGVCSRLERHLRRKPRRQVLNVVLPAGCSKPQGFIKWIETMTTGNAVEIRPFQIEARREGYNVALGKSSAFEGFSAQRTVTVLLGEQMPKSLFDKRQGELSENLRSVGPEHFADVAERLHWTLGLHLFHADSHEVKKGVFPVPPALSAGVASYDGNDFCGQARLLCKVVPMFI